MPLGVLRQYCVRGTPGASESIPDAIGSTTNAIGSTPNAIGSFPNSILGNSQCSNLIEHVSYGLTPGIGVSMSAYVHGGSAFVL
jgi:hypothetical protein